MDDRTARDRERERGLRPVRPSGGPAEINALVQARNQRTLTDDERLRLAALTFTIRPDQERFRLLGERSPDVLAALPNEVKLELEAYLKQRANAIERGMDVAEPPAQLVAEVDALARDYEAYCQGPWPDFAGIAARGQAAIAAAIEGRSFGALLDAWFGWLAEHDAANNRQQRRAGVLNALGRPTSSVREAQPAFNQELARAVGGSVPMRPMTGRSPE